MIRNPWPLYWEQISPSDDLDLKHFMCRFGGRYGLACAAPTRRGNGNKTACKHCYIRQQSMSFLQMSREGVYIDRVCDRCGEEIPNPDTRMYLELQNDRGGCVVSMEICRSCAAELADWLKGFELPPVESEMTEDIWGD